MYVAIIGATGDVAAEPIISVQDRLLPLEVVINRAPQGNWILLEHDGALYAPDDALKEWRVARPSEAQSTAYRGQSWYRLAAISGFEERRNFTEQSIDLTFSPSAFAATRLTGETGERLAQTPGTPALFFNYDLNATQMMFRSATSMREVGALTELGFTSDIGVLTSSAVARNLGSRDATAPSSWRRLETTATRDFPDKNITVRVGDATTRSSLSGRAVYFGGVQISRNFALTPGFISQPIPTIAGVSHAPSILALYVNDVLRQTSNVPTGPFAIDNFPLLNGAGEAKLVVRDLLGRESVLTQRFFTDPTLLAPGLSDWSMEIGALRSNLGEANADYGERFISGVARYGLTPAVTLEGHGQFSKSMLEIGIGGSFAMPFQALGQAALACSRNNNGEPGYEWMASVEQDRGPHGFSVHAQSASRTYRQLGLDADVLPQRLALSATYSYATEHFGSLILGAARVQSYDRATFTTYSASYSASIGKRSSLTLSATRVTGSNSGVSFGLIFTMPLGDDVNSSASMSSRSGQTDGNISASKGLSTEIGAGWRVATGFRGNQPYSEGSMYYQGSKIMLNADVSAAALQQTIRLGAVGGLVLMDGRLLPSRRLQDSFALVEVSGYPNVGVGFQGSSLTRTDENGVALLPRLLPFQSNRIRLDPSELPISAELDSIEQVAVPAMRSGVKVVFPVRSGRGALIKIVLDDGEPAPAGAEVELIGDKKEFFVARRGEAFVTGLQSQNTVGLKWKSQSCRFAVDLPPGNLDDIARVGPLNCAGIKR